MDLYTRCANCDTTFRITTRQLQASGGQVRCGHCETIFDAFATLSVQEPLRAAKQLAVSFAQPLKQDVVVPDPSGQPAFSGQSAAQRAKTQQPRPDPAASLYEWEFRIPELPRRTFFWTGLVSLLSIALVLQAAYGFRTEVTTWLPQARSHYLRFCESLQCTIGLPKMSNYLHIEASDLKVVDLSHPNEIQLLLSVRNRAPIEVAYPSFELTLTNPLDQALARRIFMPAEYLPTTAPSGGLKAGIELPIQLYLDTGSLRAAGYRLYLFYP